MSIAVGQKIPSVKLKYASEKGPADITTDEIFAGKKVVLFAVPGAFTPTCSNAHLPGFVVNVDAIKAKGVDTVVCMSVNDAFVMGAWGREQGTQGKVRMLRQEGQPGFSPGDGLFKVVHTGTGYTEGGFGFLDLLIDGAHIARKNCWSPATARLPTRTGSHTELNHKCFDGSVFLRLRVASFIRRRPRLRLILSA